MITILPYSRKSLLIQWDGPIRNETISEINQFNQQIQTSGIKYIAETIPAFTSITVCFEGTTFSEMYPIIEKLYSQMESLKVNNKTQRWKLPMLPLENISSLPSRISEISSNQFYASFFELKFTIGMKGFLPGFLYLAGLPESMHIPRKSVPNPAIPKGSVAIGGSQCGIYPKSSPGGWHIIGNCPIPLIDFEIDKLSCFDIGDEIQFELIDEAKHILYNTTKWSSELTTSKFLVHE